MCIYLISLYESSFTTNFHWNTYVKNKAPIGAWEEKLEITTDRPTDQPTDGHEVS